MYIIHLINALLMFIIPIGLAFFAIARFKLGWRLWWIGGTIFILSQVGHIPFNYLAGIFLNKTSLVELSKTNQVIFNACFLGISAGLWEESSRYGMYRWWTRESRSWRNGTLLGIGHGGFESILVGVLVLYSYLQMLALKDLNLGNLVPADQIIATTKNIQTYWGMPWYDAMLGSLERTLTIPIQISLSILVLQVFQRQNIAWWFLAVLFHAAIDAIAVIFISFSNIYLTEIIIALISLLCIWIILHFRTSEPLEKNNEVIDNKAENISIIKELSIDVEETNENLDKSIYL
jgi:uncharacterized membrane protein YhfC